MSFQLRGPSIKNKRSTSLKTCRTLLTKRFEFQRKEKKNHTYEKSGVRIGMSLLISTPEENEALPSQFSSNAISNYNSISSQTVC